MLVVVQKVSEASVSIHGKIKSSIHAGLLVLLGITHEDTKEDIDWLCAKISHLRIFPDKDDKMNLSLTDIQGEIMVISQFTLYASTKKGNRPSFLEAARPETAKPLYELFVEQLGLVSGCRVNTGEFGADMKVSLINDGPVTILIDSKERK